MIKNKEDLLFYLKSDKKALGNIKKSHPKIFGDEIWKFQISLRKLEYYSNIKETLWVKMKKNYYKFIHHYRGRKLGFSIPINVFGPGLRINHYGYLIVHGNVRIGAYCDIHQGVHIGQNKDDFDVPEIGNNVYIGPGAKIFGKVRIADNIAIGANAVVTKDFLEEDITIAGVPARKIKNTGTSEMNVVANPNFFQSV